MFITDYLRDANNDPVPNGTNVEIRTDPGNVLLTTATTTSGRFTYEVNGSPGYVKYSATVGGDTIEYTTRNIGPGGVVQLGELDAALRAITDGVVFGLDSALAITPAVSGWTVNVDAGAAVVGGNIYRQYTSTTATFVPTPIYLDIVRSYNLDLVVHGRSSTTPGLTELIARSAPTTISPTIPAGALHITLATVSIDPVSTSLVPGNITDVRPYASARIADASITPVKLNNNGTLSTAEVARVFKAATSGTSIDLSTLTTTELDDIVAGASASVAGDILYRRSDGKLAPTPGLTIATKRQMQYLVQPGSTAPLSAGWPTGNTLDGTLADATSSDGPWIQHTTTAVSGNAVGVIGAPSSRRAWLPELITRIKTPSVITQIRLWVGLFASSPAGVGVLGAIQGAGFRYTENDATAFWRCTASGGTATTVTTTKAIAADTVYTLRVRFENDGFTRTFWIDDELVATITDNWPDLNQTLDVFLRLTTLTTATRNLRWSRLALLHL